MKRTILFSTFSLLILSSCTNFHFNIPDYSFDDVPIIIDMDSVITDTLKFNRIRYIPLETTDECLIGAASKTMIKNDKIYVCDYSRANALFVFDMTGKFLFKIARMGQGPGEYIRITDFDIQTNDDIYLYDGGSGRKILVFDSKGTHLMNIQMNYRCKSFCLIDNKIYWSKPSDYRNFACLVAYDMDNKKTEILLDEKYVYDSKIDDFHPFDFYHSPDTVIFYAPKFSKIIYTIDKEGIHPAIGVKNLKETPKSTIVAWLQEDDYLERHKLMTHNKYFVDLAYIFENENYICFNFNMDRDIVLYNKHSKSTFLIPRSSLLDSFGDRLIKGSTGKDFFGVIAFNPDMNRHKKILESREELKNWQEDDNPVVVIFNPDN